MGPSFRAKRLRRARQITIFFNFRRWTLISFERVALFHFSIALPPAIRERKTSEEEEEEEEEKLGKNCDFVCPGKVDRQKLRKNYDFALFRETLSYEMTAIG